MEREGITVDEFEQITECNGARCSTYRPYDTSEEFFRQAIMDTTSRRTIKHPSFLVVSFSRKTLGQTGDGHFSPIAAYHPETDSALVLDVARFKYPPYWCPVSTLWKAMAPIDNVTGQPRGFFMLSPPNVCTCQEEKEKEKERYKEKEK